MKSFMLSGFSAALILILGAPTSTSADVAKPGDRKPAPDFALTDHRDGWCDCPAHKGRVVLLDFWATWCTGCKVEIPWYMEFHKKYKASGLAAIGVAMDEKGWATVRP
jgi:thiol-disulfide isomerase/thioredoxin